MDAGRYFQDRCIRKSFLRKKLTSSPAAVLLRAMGQRVRRFLIFLYCLLFASSLLGCAAPLSLESLSALNRRAYAGGICGVPKGTPPNIHFYAVNIAMGKVVTDRNPAALRRFMPNADSVHEVRPWAPLSSAKTVPIALDVTCPARKELPTDLQAALNEIVGSSCKTPENNRPNPQYLGQTFQDAGSSNGLELKLVATVLTWALQEASASEPRIPVPTTRQLLPLPPTEWEPLTPAVEGETASTLEHPVVQFSGGAVAGGLIAPVPFGAMGADVAIELRLLPKGTYWARVGKASGEIVVGTGQMILAGVGMGAGVGMTGTGGGAPAGVLVVSASYAIGVNGCITAGHGAADLKHLLREGDVPSGSSAPAPRRLLPKKVAKKAPTQAPAAEPATSAVKPATPPKAPTPKAADKPATPPVKPAQPTTPQQTTTKTLYRSTGKTVTKTGETTTTTTPKGKPSATGTPATPVATPTTAPTIRNAHLAGKTHPKTGVRFDANGYPDFRAAGVVKKEVKIKFSGNTKKDFIEADKLSGLNPRPKDYTWHHHQDGTTMQLVPRNIHQQTGHTGGMALMKTNQ